MSGDKWADWPVKAVREKDVRERREVAEKLRGAASSPDNIENGGTYRQALARGKRSACAITDTASATLCGIARRDADGDDVLEVSRDVWMAIADVDVVADGYRPCADCAAAYRAIPSPGRKKIAWESKEDPATGKTTHSMKLITAASPVTERLPENVAPDGSTPRDAERDERVWARLGNVVPRLLVGEDGSLDRESLWTAGSKVVHAGAKIGKRVYPACRDNFLDKPKAAEDGKILNCPACKKILQTGKAAGSTSAGLSEHMLSVVNRPHDADRFRPVGGVGEYSADQRTRPVDERRLYEARSRETQLMRGLGVLDGGRVSQSAYQKYEIPGRLDKEGEPLTMALQGWAAEELAGVVRDESGRLTHMTGWEYVRENGKVPPALWRRMDRAQKTACVRGMKAVRERSKRIREITKERERAQYAASAMVGYRYASQHGTTQERPVHKANPYPRPGGVYDELRFKREN